MSDTHKITLTEAERFFYAHAGYSYDPKTETAASGRTRAAVLLADAESRMTRSGAEVRWELDDQPWDGDGEYNGPMWAAALMPSDADGEANLPLGSLCAIAIDSHDPAGEPYGRVVAAELALEYL